MPYAVFELLQLLKTPHRRCVAEPSAGGTAKRIAQIILFQCQARRKKFYEGVELTFTTEVKFFPTQHGAERKVCAKDAEQYKYSSKLRVLLSYTQKERPFAKGTLRCPLAGATCRGTIAYEHWKCSYAIVPQHAAPASGQRSVPLAKGLPFCA